MTALHVDLSKAQKGDYVIFLDGAHDVIEQVDTQFNYRKVPSQVYYTIQFKHKGECEYVKEGRPYFNSTSPVITKVIRFTR